MRANKLNRIFCSYSMLILWIFMSVFYKDQIASSYILSNLHGNLAGKKYSNFQTKITMATERQYNEKDQHPKDEAQAMLRANYKLPLSFDPNTHSYIEVEEDSPGNILGAFVIIDPFCEFLGQHLSAIVRSQGYAVVELLSDYLMSGLGAKEELYHMTIPLEGKEKEWASDLPFPIIAVLSESDAGLEVAERIHEALGAKGNGINNARRNKYLMNETVKQQGLKTVKHKLAESWEEAKGFLEVLNSGTEKNDCIIKPYRGCSSNDVFYCQSENEAQFFFSRLLGTKQYGGGLNDQVLVQEYLQGQEYAIDTVSCEGVHKIVALWKYDKRLINGSPFVYFSTELVPNSDNATAKVLEYTCKVLDALKIQYGPAHTEIILTADGPVLVEMNGRWHLADVAPITNLCIGGNSVELTADCFMNKNKFLSFPCYPSDLSVHGRVVHLVSEVTGELVEIRHMQKIESLPSVSSVEIFPEFQVGNVISPTVDIKTDAGAILLIHSDKDQVESDYRTILKLQKTMFKTVTLSST